MMAMSMNCRCTWTPGLADYYWYSSSFLWRGTLRQYDSAVKQWAAPHPAPERIRRRRQRMGKDRFFAISLLRSSTQAAEVNGSGGVLVA